MSWIKDNVLGGASKKAAEEQQKHMYLAQDMLRESVDEARGEVKPLFADAMAQSQGGYQDAVNLLSGSLAPQMGMTQGGNVAAQQTLLAGMPQFQNAILGAPVDYSAFQPSQIDYSQYLPQQAPQTYYTRQQEAAAQQPAPEIPAGSGQGSQNFQGIAGGGGMGAPIIGSDGGFFMNGFNSGVPLSTLNNIFGDGSNILSGGGYAMGTGNNIPANSNSLITDPTVNNSGRIF